MARQQPFSLIFDPEVKQHLCAIEAKYHSLLRTTRGVGERGVPGEFQGS